jgi:two-component system response regulator AtoC
MESIKVLVVEESPTIRDYLTEAVQSIGYHGYAVEQKTEFMAAFHLQNPDLLLLGPSNHVEQIGAFAELVERTRKGTPILCVPGDSSERERKEIPANAHILFLPKNADSGDIKRVIERLVEEYRYSAYKELDQTIVSQSWAMKQIKNHIVRVSKSDVNVLISGESGTGKELVAHAIHNLSLRAEKPFIKVNSAALPSNLLESELFGYEKGAFTGAFKRKPGKFKLADLGTIFLDEIGDVPLSMQAKLLQVLESNKFAALGSLTTTTTNVRVLVATNNNLEEMVSDGRFRSDLYYRLNVVPVHVPPLRERKEDIYVLCRHFLKKHSRCDANYYRPLKERTWKKLHEYPWPGNVRELENFIKSISLLGEEKVFRANMGVFGPSDISQKAEEPWLPAQPARASGSGLLLRRSLKDVGKEAARKAETEVIVDALFHTRWNRRKAAVLLKISYKALLSKVKAYDIETRYRELFKKGP